MDLRKFLDQKIVDVRSVWTNPDIFPANDLAEMLDTLYSTLMRGNKIAFMGNGGAAADAMHIAAEFTGKCVVDHEPLPVLCLNESQSFITAASNDYGFENSYSRLVKAHLKKNDLLIGLSTSGKSKNIINALNAAVAIGVQSILWTGNVDIMLPNVRIYKIDSSSTPRIQEVMLAWGHILAEVTEANLEGVILE